MQIAFQDTLVLRAPGRILAVLRLLLPVWGLVAQGDLRAHTPSETYLALTLQGTNCTGQWDVATRDLAQGLGLTPESAQALPAVEWQRRQEAISLDTISRLELKADGHALGLRVTDLFPVTLNSLEYLRVLFAVEPPLVAPPTVLDLNARSLFGIDTNMHGLLRFEQGGRTEAAAFNKDRVTYSFKLTEPPDRWAQARTFVWEGVWHIWIGFDHILFLIALLLPSVLRREGTGWVGVDRFRAALVHIVKIVTAFTLAHSITLSLAALEVITLPGRLVEPVIAASVVAAALNNLRPWFGERGWMVAFGFGLVHGFGFAGVLSEFGLARASLALALVGFNVGVELGQLAIVAVFLPVAFGLRRSWAYQKLTFKFGSALVALLAAVWMVERAFDVKVLPF